MTSFTVSFTGTSSVLRADFLPEILLDPNTEYCCGLLDFTTYNSIPNIVKSQNSDFTYKLPAKEAKTIALPTGAFEVEDILKYLQWELLRDKINLTYDVFPALLKVRLSFDVDLDWVEGTVEGAGIQKRKIIGAQERLVVLE